MKKIVSFVVVTVIFITCFASFAFAKSNKNELTFRNVPFGTSYKKTMKELEKGFKKEKIDVEFEKDFELTGIYSFQSKDYISVAGIDRFKVSLNFVWENKDNNSLEDSRFSEAYYTTTVADFSNYKQGAKEEAERYVLERSNEIIDNLKEKLESLYGTGKENGDLTNYQQVRGYTWDNFENNCVINLYSYRSQYKGKNSRDDKELVDIVLNYESLDETARKTEIINQLKQDKESSKSGL